RADPRPRSRTGLPARGACAPAACAPASASRCLCFRSSLSLLKRKTGRYCGPPGRVRSVGLRSGGRTLPGYLHESAEPLGVRDGDLGQHLAVDLDLGLAQAVDQFRVAHALLARSSVDARDPETTESPLFVATVAVGVHARPLHLLFGEPIRRMLAPVRHVGFRDLRRPGLGALQPRRLLLQNVAQPSVPAPDLAGGGLLEAL